MIWRTPCLHTPSTCAHDTDTHLTGYCSQATCTQLPTNILPGTLVRLLEYSLAAHSTGSAARLSEYTLPTHCAGDWTQAAHVHPTCTLATGVHPTPHAVLETLARLLGALHESASTAHRVTPFQSQTRFPPHPTAHFSPSDALTWPFVILIHPLKSEKTFTNLRQS